MCFVNDYDWISRQSDEATYPAEKPVRCDECGRVIEVGKQVRHIHMQEYGDGECKDCEEGSCECTTLEKDCCACDKPDTGESFEYDCCEECSKFLKAIETAEIEAGCSINEAHPPLTEMINELHEAGANETEKYLNKAIEMF